jgi:hypothetical protein
MKYVRKALVAGVVAAGGAAWTALVNGVPSSETGWLALVGSAVSAGLVAGWATWRVENAPKR